MVIPFTAHNLVHITDSSGHVHEFRATPAPILLKMSLLLPEFKDVLVITDLKQLAKWTIRARYESKDKRAQMFQSIYTAAMEAHANIDELYAAKGDPWEDFMTDCALLSVYAKVLFNAKLPKVNWDYKKKFIV